MELIMTEWIDNNRSHLSQSIRLSRLDEAVF